MSEHPIRERRCFDTDHGYIPMDELPRTEADQPVPVPQDIYHRPIEHHGGAKYIRTIYPVGGKGAPIKVDVYSVIDAFGITCPARQHAIKKLLCAGLRGKGSQVDDLKGVFDAMWRALEEQERREAVEKEDDLPQREINRLQGIIDGMAARIVAQPELLSKKAEREGLAISAGSKSTTQFRAPFRLFDVTPGPDGSMPGNERIPGLYETLAEAEVAATGAVASKKYGAVSVLDSQFVYVATISK